ncbi:hypothetical protein BKA70DRAFT_1528224 [Coprinopsis sp. MPI-PUGE-AT-0042]|nr:hypothetical protein BKA70DRAFT_1528224 [Coprinopsis sp. MPI-PUGE-AT-0042]
MAHCATAVRRSHREQRDLLYRLSDDLQDIMSDPSQDSRRRLLTDFQQRFRAVFPSLKSLTTNVHSLPELDKDAVSPLRLGLDMEYYPPEDDDEPTRTSLGSIVFPSDGFVASPKESDMVKALLVILNTRHTLIAAEKSAKTRAKYLRELDVYVTAMTPRMEATARQAAVEGSKRLLYKLENFLKRHGEGVQMKREVLVKKKDGDDMKDGNGRQHHHNHHHQSSLSGGSSSSLRKMVLLSAFSDKMARVQL